MKMQATLHTSGKGYWSNQVKTVSVIRARIAYLNDTTSFGELHVYFDTKTWFVPKDGLIYSDSKFLIELRHAFQSFGFSTAAVDNITYSEQGMQGDDYVSLDVGERFLNDPKTIELLFDNAS